MRVERGSLPADYPISNVFALQLELSGFSRISSDHQHGSLREVPHSRSLKMSLRPDLNFEPEILRVFKHVSLFLRLEIYSAHKIRYFCETQKIRYILAK